MSIDTPIERAPTAAGAPRGVLDGIADGEMADRIRSFDWSTTPIGPIEHWSPALRIMVRILLSNRIPAMLWWGPDYVSFYNDAYIPVLGSKHPWALGRPVREVWSEIWHVLQPLIDTPFNGGPATWNDDIELELNRHGFVEETHFTIAYSPVPDEGVPSGIGGVLATVVETTDKVIAERRVRALRDIGTRSVEGLDGADPTAAATDSLDQHPKDLPFALIYLVDDDGATARLAAASGLDARNDAAAPSQIPLAGTGSARPWPIAETLRAGVPLTVDDLAERLGDARPAGPWSDPPTEAALLPIPSSTAGNFVGVLVAGVSSRRRLDEQYRAFLELVAGQIGAGVANARAFEAERRRAESLAELDRAKTVFFSNVSHEFRTPLTMMLGPIRDLLDDDADPLSPAQREQVALADRSSRRLLRLVNALLEFSRIEAGRLEASFEATDVGQLTSDLASQFRAAIERAGLELVVDVEPIREQVLVDRDLWEKVVLNLLSNALKSTFEGSISVRVRPVRGAVLLEVADTGVGIAEADLARIFERFHRVEHAPSRTNEGSGIGLSLVQEVARIHGGEVSVESTAGVGSTFRVRIPTGARHLPKDRIAAPRRLPSTATGAEAFVEEALAWLPDAPSEPAAGRDARAGHHLDDANAAQATDVHDVAWIAEPDARILVVDDNADMRRYLGRLLGRHWTVEIVRDGRAALEALGNRDFQLVLSDVMMPNVDGLELVAAIRADARTRDIPVLLLSARAGEEARMDGAAAGADEYLVKPFSSRELIARVSGALRLASARREGRAALRETNAQLQAALAVKDEFLGLVSHELRTPLTVILGMSKVLERIGTADLRARELAADVAESADVLNGLVESMLLLAKINRDEADALREPVLLNHAAGRILDERRRRDPSRSYELQVDDPGALVIVQPTWLERVIDNFVGNAAKYSVPGTPICVVVDTADEVARIRVIDTGPGLEEEELGRVFEPFYRTPRARERAGGAGLGLAVAKRIVELMGGTIWAARTAEGGTEFGFTLPKVTDIEP
jgi:signal transduction histidine kinase